MLCHWYKMLVSADWLFGIVFFFKFRTYFENFCWLTALWMNRLKRWACGVRPGVGGLWVWSWAVILHESLCGDVSELAQWICCSAGTHCGSSIPFMSKSHSGSQVSENAHQGLLGIVCEHKCRERFMWGSLASLTANFPSLFCYEREDFIVGWFFFFLWLSQSKKKREPFKITVTTYFMLDIGYFGSSSPLLFKFPCCASF